MIELSVIINKRFMGAIAYSPKAFMVDGRAIVRTPMHWLFVCPICGDVWGMIQGESEYYPLRVPCEKHNWVGMVSGSILCEITDYQLNQLPEPLIQREARLHLKHWEKQHGNEETSSEE